MIKYITIELRPRLQTCNAFICLGSKVNSTDIQIKLSDESLEITIDDNVIHFITKFVKFVPTTLSSLSITNNWVCFRAQTKSDSAFGSFKTEIIANSKLNTFNLANDSFNCSQLMDANRCNVVCSCCEYTLTKEIFVKRTLPVPESNYDPSEWFCCKHIHNGTTQTLTPSEFDIFYGSLFSIMHTSLFNEFKLNENTIFCNRCLQQVGKIHTNNSIKLWSCAIDYNLNGSKIKYATKPFNDFLVAIKSSMTGMFGEEIVLQSFIGKDVHSLMLKPMDWYLNLMTEPKISSQNKVVTLQKVPVVKVLYKYDTNRNINDSVNKTYCEVSFLVLKAGLEHLVTSTRRFPHVHRTASDFYIGHICLEDPVCSS